MPDRTPEPEQRYTPPLSTTRGELLVDGKDDRFREAIYALFVTATGFGAIREAFGREIDATGPQYFILMAVAEHHGNGGVGIRGLADHLHVAPSHVTVEVNKMIERGLIAKAPHPEDGRRVLITLTASGKEAMERLAPLRQRINDILFDGFDGEEFLALARFLDRFVETTARAQREIALHEQRQATQRQAPRAAAE